MVTVKLECQKCEAIEILEGDAALVIVLKEHRVSYRMHEIGNLEAVGVLHYTIADILSSRKQEQE